MSADTTDTDTTDSATIQTPPLQSLATRLTRALDWCGPAGCTCVCKS